MSNRSRIWEKHETEIGIKAVRPARRISSFLWLAIVAAMVISASVSIMSQDQPATQPPATQPPETQPSDQTPAPGPEANSPGPQAEPQGAAPLRVLVGKSLLINTTERLKRISVTDDAIADAIVVTPTQILVHGRRRSFVVDLG
jgi:Flp pilus assembly secretin CpaC